MPELLPTTKRALLHRVAVEQAECRVPSLVAGVVRGGELLWSAGRGRVGDAEPGADTQYRIGSITKTFVAVLVMRLRDEGKVRLDDHLDAYVSGTPVGDRSLVHLLSHGSGLSSEIPGDWWERSYGRDEATLLTALTGDSVKHPAGRRYHYSNPGIALLGTLVERLRGRPWFDVLRDEVLAPLGMERTSYHPRPPHAQGYGVHPYADVVLREPHTDTAAMAPAGQLWSTVGDLARWAAFLTGDTGGALAPATVEEMRQPIHVEDDDTWSHAYGLGVGVDRARGRRLVGHGGSMPGFLANVSVQPEDGTGAICLANATSGLSGTFDLDLLDLLDEHEPAIPEPWLPRSVPDDVLAIVGPWYWGTRPHTLSALGDDLLGLRAGSARRSARFRAEPDGTWTGLDGYHAGETLQVVRRDDGTVSHLDIGTFCFTRSPYDPAAPIPGGLPDEGWTAG
ncbi:MAG: serine hydrolase domain-containing protein [Streptosporangiales bacterium]